MTIQVYSLGTIALGNSNERFGKKKVRRHGHSDIPRGRPLFPKSSNRQTPHRKGTHTPGQGYTSTIRGKAALLEVMI